MECALLQALLPSAERAEHAEGARMDVLEALEYSSAATYVMTNNNILQRSASQRSPAHSTT